MGLGARNPHAPRSSGEPREEIAAQSGGGGTGRAAPDILVVGEALIDIVGHADGSEERVPGGSPANVALGLGRLGIRTAFLSHLARDVDGASIQRRLAGSGIDVLPASFSAERTPTALVELDGDGDGHASYSFAVTWELPPAAEIALPGALHVGSYSAFLVPGAEQVLALASGARAAGKLVTLDPNIRPALIDDPEHVRARFEELAGLADVVKLSDEDASWLYPGDTIEETLDRILGLGAQLAAITRGRAGAVLATRAGRAEVSAPETRAIDTIGAGDSFMAALIAAVLPVDDAPGTAGPPRALGNAELAEIGGLCAAAAALTVSRRGADLPTRSELAALRIDQTPS